MADNYFLILGLGTYKPDAKYIDTTLIGTSDEDSAVLQLIKNAIDAKRLEWTKGQLDPRNGAKFKHYLELIPKMEPELALLETRKRLYAEARDEITKLLKRPLGNLVGKGFVYLEELERVAKQTGVPLETIKNFNSADIREKAATGEKLEKPAFAAKHKENDSRLQTYGYADIYAFLLEGTPLSRAGLSTAADWLDMSKEVRSNLPAHNKQDIADKKKICEFCIAEVFVSEEKKKEYDAYLAWKRISDILQDVKQATIVTKELTPGQATEFIDQLQAVGITKPKAISYLRYFCSEQAIAWASEGAEKLSTRVLCPYCPTMVEATARICPACGGEIIVSCPKCGAEHSVRERFCSTKDCGYDFNNLKRAVALCEKAKIEIDLLNLSLAKVILDEAESLCKTVKEIKQLRLDWKQKNDRYGSIVQRIQGHVAAKRIVTAKREFDSLKSQFPQYSNPELEENISAALVAAKDAYALSQKEADTLESCKHALRAYQSCRDYPGIQEALSRFKPTPVSSVQVATDTNRRVNILTWDAKQNDITTYRIVRKTGAKPISSEDCDKSWEVSSNTYTDSEIEPAVVYYYAVVSCVGPTESALVHSLSPMANLFEVQHLSVQNNKSSIYAKWANVPPNAEVEVWRDRTSVPQKVGDGQKVSNVTVHEMSDQGLENDVLYHYRVFLKYKQGNSTICSSGVSFSGTPSAPPRAIEYVMVKHKRENTFEVEWDAEKGEAVSFYLMTALNVKQDQQLSQDELNKLAFRAGVTSTGDNKGEFDVRDAGMYYLFPVTQKHSTAVVGCIVPVTSQRLISNISVKLSGNDIVVKFPWPKDIKHVLLLYRSDRYPVSTQDIDARRKRVTKSVYDIKQAISLSSLPKGTYYFSLFAELETSGSVTYSIPDYFTFRYGTQIKVTYDIKAQRSFGKLKSVKLVISPPTDGELPALTVVANNGSLPVFRSQGFVVKDIPSQQVTGKLEVDLPTEQFTKNTYLKVFAKNEQEAEGLEISLLPGASAQMN